MWLFFQQPFPVVLRLYHVFLDVTRDMRWQWFVTASGGTNVPQALGCRDVPESWLLPLWNDCISCCSAVSLSFCSVHVINNATNVEYFKRWLLLLSSIPMNNTDGYWDKSASSVPFFMVYIFSSIFSWVLSFSSLFLSLLFLRSKILIIFDLSIACSLL